jgi:hypothetical protein
MVVQFGMTNASMNFQGYIITAIIETLDDVLSAYLDDVSRYSDSKEDHIGHDK